jgi:hypothetical protein
MKTIEISVGYTERVSLKEYMGKKATIISTSNHIDDINIGRSGIILADASYGNWVCYKQSNDEVFKMTQYGYTVRIELEDEFVGGEEIYVSDCYEDCHDKIKKMFVSYHPFSAGVFCVFSGDEIDAKAGKLFNQCYWKYAKKIEKKVWKSRPLSSQMGIKIIVEFDGVLIKNKKFSFDDIDKLFTCMQTEKRLMSCENGIEMHVEKATCTILNESFSYEDVRMMWQLTKDVENFLKD